MRTRRFLAAAAIVLIAASSQAVTTKDMDTGGVTAAEVVKALTGPGVQISNVKITGAKASIGTFTGGTPDGLAVEEGVILSTGDIKDAAGPNTAPNTSGSMGQAGDADLDALVKPYATHDAMILEFDAETVGTTFSIRYVFASEEYTEYVGTQYNDVFAFFVDGSNIALAPASTDPVSINSINNKLRATFYVDNPPGSGAHGTSFDGFTTELIAIATVTPGPHHIKLAIADTSDSIYDAAVFLAQGGISGSAVAAAVVPEIHELLLSNLEKIDVTVTVYGIPEGSQPEMSAWGLPEDSTVTFTKIAELGPAAFVYTMHITIGPGSVSGAYPLVIRAGFGETESFGTMMIIIDCTSPMILGTPGHQPESTSVRPGSTATLKVVPNGTSVFQYQWYAGHTGSTVFPIAGATASTLTTPPITAPAEFWVRVMNPCGSADSATATVTPQP